MRNMKKPSNKKNQAAKGPKGASAPDLHVRPRKNEYLPIILAFLALVLIGAGIGAYEYARQQRAEEAKQSEFAPVLPTASLTVNGVTVIAEIAATREEMAQGLMFRKGLLEDHGMLFVYEEPRVLGFWMKNTLIPLSIAFIDTRQRIISIHDMEPLDATTRHAPPRAAQFALEMTQGWFARHDIQPGDKVEIPADILALAGLRATPSTGATPANR